MHESCFKERVYKEAPLLVLAILQNMMSQADWPRQLSQADLHSEFLPGRYQIQVDGGI